MTRIDEILRILAALTAEVHALRDEQEPAVVEVPDFDGATYTEGLAFGPRGGFLVEGIGGLRRRAKESRSRYADLALVHPNLTSEFLLNLSGSQARKLRASRPDMWIDWYQNVVLGRLIIPGGGQTEQRVGRGLTFRQAYDYDAIGVGESGTLPGVLVDEFSRSPAALLLTLADWLEDFLAHGPVKGEWHDRFGGDK